MFAVVEGRAPQSFVVWLIQSLGFGGLLAVLAGIAVFLGACAVVFLARRPAVIAAYLVFVPLPFLLGIFAALKGFVSSFVVLAMSDVQLKPSQFAAGNAEIAAILLTSLMVSFPAYFVTAIGLLVRTAADRPADRAADRAAQP